MTDGVPGPRTGRRGFPRRLPRRPFAASALMTAAGVELAYPPLRHPEFLGLQGLGGTSALLIAAALTGCGVLVLCRPRHASVIGVAAVVLGLVSCPMANLGGFVVGMVLAVLGGAFALAWSPASGGPTTA
ncbi:hypothetical protein SCATT_p13260 (plasmid) [Streptantibioticus cattleyicolor NRRL 8057 = DSM 46488]|uniref:Integral membrane protein n=1 Tax=Streptantibioticus cattleyicolor (strain ATCC 35852 / DSM 46488 / JCM 4925 / NBRC 14057 / NRRL 8057) TaxID=1003195 RepID=G8XFQ8_STREN|nr:hypothetical protein SCATT_p13260 [Streptantibioticus cattleyicolor NRRL 8057 = DSM 46488]